MRATGSTLNTFEYPEELLEFILNSGSAYICVKDRDGRFVYINDLDASLFQSTPEKMIGKTAEPWVGREQFLEWQKSDLAVFDQKEKVVFSPYSRVDKAGNSHWFDTIKIPFHDIINNQQLLLIMHRDITHIKQEETERELLHQKLVAAQKKELIGLLAGNVAHDFNNLLTIILTSTKLIQSDPHLSEQSKECGETILTTSFRAAAIVSRLLVLGGHSQDKFTHVELNQWILDEQNLWKSILGKNIQVVYSLTDLSTGINGNVSLLQQAFLQLILNARDAIKDAGSICLTTFRGRSAKGSHLVKITLTDDGLGMDAGTIKQIFNPLFSTKPAGQGSGLGLTLVESVVEKHQGGIKVDSSIGKGTSITIEFPYSSGVTTAYVAPQVQPAKDALNGKTVLIVEDEETLRKLVSTVLGAQGATILVAADGESAWNLLVQRSFKVDCLLTDIVMPGSIDGVSLRRKLSRQSPSIPAVLMSGHSFDFLLQDEPLPDHTKFLKKPFTPEFLIKELSQSLGE